MSKSDPDLCSNRRSPVLVRNGTPEPAFSVYKSQRSQGYRCDAVAGIEAAT